MKRSPIRALRASRPERESQEPDLPTSLRGKGLQNQKDQSLKDLAG